MPAPEPPMMTAVSLRRRCMVMPWRTAFLPNDFFTLSTRMWSSRGILGGVLSGFEDIRREGYHAAA